MNFKGDTLDNNIKHCLGLCVRIKPHHSLKANYHNLREMGHHKHILSWIVANSSIASEEAILLLHFKTEL